MRVRLSIHSDARRVLVAVEDPGAYHPLLAQHDAVVPAVVLMEDSQATEWFIMNGRASNRQSYVGASMHYMPENNVAGMQVI